MPQISLDLLKILKQSVYCKRKYPVSLYRKFEFIPKKELKSIINGVIEIIVKHLNISNHTKSVSMLFAGGGFGRIELPFLKYFEKRYPELIISATFVDFSYSMIKELRKEIKNINIKTKIKIIRDDITKVEIDKTYDVVFSLFSFHLFGNKKESLMLLNSFLNPNGLIILSEETGDFNFLENNVGIIEGQTAYSEYSRFWQYYHNKMDITNKYDYTCDLNFINQQRLFDVIRSVEFEWHLKNISYNDISNFITGKYKIYDFFNYSIKNNEILTNWLTINSFRKNKRINRIEGHRFYFLKRVKYVA